jgi:hypothetical protein
MEEKLADTNSAALDQEVEPNSSAYEEEVEPKSSAHEEEVEPNSSAHEEEVEPNSSAHEEEVEPNSSAPEEASEEPTYPLVKSLPQLLFPAQYAEPINGFQPRRWLLIKKLVRSKYR